jgi:hypothetical protein
MHRAMITKSQPGTRLWITINVIFPAKEDEDVFQLSVVDLHHFIIGLKNIGASATSAFIKVLLQVEQVSQLLSFMALPFRRGLCRKRRINQSKRVLEHGAKE